MFSSMQIFFQRNQKTIFKLITIAVTTAALYSSRQKPAADTDLPKLPVETGASNTSGSDCNGFTAVSAPIGPSEYSFIDIGGMQPSQVMMQMQPKLATTDRAKQSQNGWIFSHLFGLSKQIIKPKSAVSLDPGTGHYFSFFQQQYPATRLDKSEDPSTYYHSIGGMNPMKLIGLLQHGILSKSEALEKGISTDSTGFGHNGLHWVSVSTKLGGCVSTDQGAFHLAIARSKLTSSVRSVPNDEMTYERQVLWKIPPEAIQAIYLEAAGILDMEHPDSTLGISYYNIERSRKQVQSYVDFMIKEFSYHLPPEDQSAIENKLVELERTNNQSALNYFQKCRECEHHTRCIDVILKKHLKLCYQTVIPKDSITPYDIVRYHAPNIPVYNFEGCEISASYLDQPQCRLT